MKILTFIFTVTLIFQLKAQANTNISHAIAMHGDPKYSNDFKNVEYTNPDSIKGGLDSSLICALVCEYRT